MGLIDDVRKRRDSWAKRYEEHRIEEEYDFEYHSRNAQKLEKEIEENKKKVGVFSPKENK